jgi:BirA family transcriptional regulator, biotin operon repressor / biotin---[acetyl-CoA-carboxylase] ligase
MTTLPDDLSHQALAAQLQNRPFQFFPSIHSTNTAAQNWVNAGAVHGSVVVADEQVQGRGRLARTWQTPPGQAIAMSLILRRPFSYPEIERLTMGHSLAVAETLMQRTTRPIRLKWPNDILLHGKKVCGILLELLWQGNHLNAVIVGIGVNVRVDFSSNPILKNIATSLETHTDQTIWRAELIRDILQRIDHWLDNLMATTLVHRYRNLLSTLGTTVHLKTSFGQVVGVAEDVDPAGALWVRLESGQLLRITVGDIVA